MNTDIIALAKEAGLREKYGFVLQSQIKTFATLLEAEIRKEYEAELTELKGQLSYALAGEKEAMRCTDSLTEQNAKLMAALDLYCPGHILLNPERLAIIEPIVDELIAALTPQEVKE